MIARRLLIAGGGAIFTPPPVPPPDVVNIVAAPDAGGWTEVAGPHAAYKDGVTYIGWVGGNSKPNDIEVIAYESGSYDGPVLLHDHLTTGSSTDPDSHNAPAVLVTSDGYILLAYCGHQESLMRTKRSNNPDDITGGFTVASSFSHTGVTWTYPQLAQLSAAGDRIYIRMRGHTTAFNRGAFWQNHSDDGGLTWGSEFELYRPTTGAPLVYSAFASNGVDRIDYAVTDYAADHVGGYGLWHFYMDEAGDFFESDGTPMGSPRFDEDDLTEIVATGGDAYPYSVSYTDDGRPVIACQSKAADPVEIFEYRWTGSAWERNDITTSDPFSPSILTVGGGCHVWNDSERFITSRMDGGDLIVSEYRSSDDGDTWSHFADYGSGSSPVYVREGIEVVALWFAPASSFVTSDDFDPGLAGVA